MASTSRYDGAAYFAGGKLWRHPEQGVMYNPASGAGKRISIKTGDSLVQIQPVLPEVELLKIEDARNLVGGISRNHFYDLIRQGLLPQPVKLGTQCSRWVKAELLAVIAAQAAKRATKPTVRTNNRQQ